MLFGWTTTPDLGRLILRFRTRAGGWFPALGYLRQYEKLIDKAKDGTITSAEVELLVSGFDQAELYQYDQAKQQSITLLEEWLVKYKFKDWTKTQTRGAVSHAGDEEAACVRNCRRVEQDGQMAFAWARDFHGCTH